MSKKSRARQKRARENKTEPRTNPSPGIPHAWIIWPILSVTFLVFSNSLLNGFAYDDTTQILKNELIRDLRNAPKTLVTEAWYWRAQQDKDPNAQDKPSTPYYRPVTMIYLMVVWSLFGSWSPGWHIISVLVHIIAVYLAYRVCEKVTNNTRLAAIASLLFAVHPLRSESVAWISGVTDPLLAVFVLSSFYFYVRWREENRVRVLAASLILFLLGIFGKEPAIALPIFIFAYELFVRNQADRLRDRARSAVVCSSWFFALSALYFAARYYALGFVVNNPDFKSYSLSQIVMTIPLAIWKYIGLLFWPFELTLFHRTTIVKNVAEWRFIVPLLGLIALMILLRPLWKSVVARFGLLWLAINLLPVLNLGAFGEDFLIQERYLYLPSIGFSLLIAMGLAGLPVDKLLPRANRSRAQTVVATLLILLLAGKSLAQNATWRDDITVWTHGVEIAPEQPMSHFILGHKLLNRADYNGAIEEFEKYVKIIPDNPIVLGNLASALVLTYQNELATGVLVPDRAPLDRALELCEKGLGIDPTSATLWDAMGNVHTFETGLKNYDRAIACFERGLLVAPENSMIKFHLGGTLIKKGKLDDGIALLQDTVARSPEIVDAHKFLAYAYRARGQFKPAIDELTLYLKLKPDAPDASKISKDVDDLRARLQPVSPQS